MLPHLIEQSSLSKIKGELASYLREQFREVLSDSSSLSKGGMFQPSEVNKTQSNSSQLPHRDQTQSNPSQLLYRDQTQSNSSQRTHRDQTQSNSSQRTHRDQTQSGQSHKNLKIEEKILLEQPRHSAHGHLAWPLFHLAKQYKKAPQQLADEFSQKIQQSLPSFLKSCEALSGFVNFCFQEDYIQKHLIHFMERENLIQMRSDLSQSKKREHWVLDFASPNIAKYMNIGHLRAAVLGQALVNLARAFDIKVTAVNHLGDWGSQFGKLLWAYKEWGGGYDFKNKAFESLVNLYVRFYEEAESDPQKVESARQMFKKLEEGDKELKKLWKFFVDLSLESCFHYWSLFNVKHDLVLGESFYAPFVEDLKKRLNKKKLLKASEGAEVVFLENSKTPCLISKSDGASTYSSRDLCSIIYRFEKLKADRNIYITGSDQILHFKQIFEVMEKLEPDWDSLHLSFGMYRFKGEGKMSTRRGRAVYIQDIVEQAVDRVKKIIQERESSKKESSKQNMEQAVDRVKKTIQERESSTKENQKQTSESKNQPAFEAKGNLDPKQSDKLKITEQVAIGALIFNDLMQDRIKDVDFNWSKVLDFDGSSGPFVQYSLVRARSLLIKAGFIVNKAGLTEKTADLTASKAGLTENEAGFTEKTVSFESSFEDEEEKQLAWLLLQFESVCFQSLKKLKPHILARYLLSLSKEFNRFYNAKKIIGHPREKDHLRLTQMTYRVLFLGLELLNIPRPTAM